MTPLESPNASGAIRKFTNVKMVERAICIESQTPLHGTPGPTCRMAMQPDFVPSEAFVSPTCEDEGVSFEEELDQELESTSRDNMLQKTTMTSSKSILHTPHPRTRDCALESMMTTTSKPQPELWIEQAWYIYPVCSLASRHTWTPTLQNQLLQPTRTFFPTHTPKPSLPTNSSPRSFNPLPTDCKDCADCSNCLDSCVASDLDSDPISGSVRKELDFEYCVACDLDCDSVCGSDCEEYCPECSVLCNCDTVSVCSDPCCLANMATSNTNNITSTQNGSNDEWGSFLTPEGMESCGIDASQTLSGGYSEEQNTQDFQQLGAWAGGLQSDFDVEMGLAEVDEALPSAAHLPADALASFSNGILQILPVDSSVSSPPHNPHVLQYAGARAPDAIEVDVPENPAPISNVRANPPPSQPPNEPFLVISSANYGLVNQGDLDLGNVADDLLAYHQPVVGSDPMVFDDAQRLCSVWTLTGDQYVTCGFAAQSVEALDAHMRADHVYDIYCSHRQGHCPWDTCAGCPYVQHNVGTSADQNPPTQVPADPTLPSIPRGSSGRRRTAPKSNKCDKCDMAFITKGELTDHKNAKHVKYAPGDKKPKECNQCDASFVDASGLASHKKIHKEAEYTCPWCDKGFKRSDQLKRHCLVNVESVQENGSLRVTDTKSACTGLNRRMSGGTEPPLMLGDDRFSLGSMLIVREEREGRSDLWLPAHYIDCVKAHNPNLKDGRKKQ